jgi:4-diphosphocytidyl-2C-methyl-D-erythritol kinase
VARHAINDFEAVVPALHAGVASTLPVVRRLAEAASSATEPALGMLSGSGATCFVLHAGALAEPAPLAGVRWLATRTATAIVAPAPIF